MSSSQELDDKLATETAESTLTSEDQNKDGFIDLQEFMSNSAGDGADEDFADDHDDFDDEGNEKHTDYLKMMKIVMDFGYHGYVGIEYEGGGLDEYAGIRATKALLERVREQLA